MKHSCAAAAYLETHSTWARTAVLADGYRYALVRSRGDFRGPVFRVTWVMLNPSIADASVDDPTIRKVIGFSESLMGASDLALSITVVNLYAFIATNPRELTIATIAGRDVVGVGNDAHVLTAISGADRVIMAWGAHRGPNHDARVRFVDDAIRRRAGGALASDFLCLGRTKKGGAPCHPLMLAYATPFKPYQVAA